MPQKLFTPSTKILERYADVLVNFALGGGVGIKRGEVVVVQANECTKPLYVEVVKAVWKSGGHVISRYTADVDENHNLDRHFYELAEDHQLDFFPKKYLRGIVEEADHALIILSETDPHALHGVDPKKIMRRSASHKPYMDWRNKKELAGKFTWTLALYGTPAMAREANLSLEEYWQQIINACFLNKKDPIKEWRSVAAKIDEYRAKLNALPIENVKIKGPDVDLVIHIGKNRQWLGGSGRNIPSFEIFTSPDWRGATGWIRFDQPLYRYGSLITGIELEFKDGQVVQSRAKKNEAVLKQMIASENADKIGEFSLTDKRFSRITKFMANTLFDENVGGKHGNTHIALGAAYRDTYVGGTSRFKKKDWDKLGFNDSVVHTDIVSTMPRTVTAILKNGEEKIIYKNGIFVL